MTRYARTAGMVIMLGLATMAVPRIARADYVYEYASVNVSGSGSQSLSFAQFNSSLGTLNSVTFSISSSTNNTGSGMAYNPNTTGQTFGVNYSQTFSASGNGLSLGLGSGANGAGYAAPRQTGYAYFGNVNLSGSQVVTSSFMGQYIGTGSITTSLSTYASFSLEYGSVNFEGGYPPTITGQATLTYSYTAVPEPASLSLCTIAILAGLGHAVARRRGRASA